MRQVASRALLLATLVACISEAAPPRPSVAESRATEVVDDGGTEIFREAGVDGAFVLLDERRALRTIVNPARAAEGYLPASTFKIPNTLIGLETGVVPNERFSLEWDRVPRAVPEWNRDQDLASAIRVSAVWFFQEIARRVGADRMQYWVNRFEYGNRSIAGGIDHFWLDGALRITPRQQVEFLRRLHERELPVTKPHAEILERLIVLEERPDAVLRGKTGLTVEDDRAVGWLVGFLERGMDRWVYATLLLAPKEEMQKLMPLRKALTKRLLAHARVLPASMATD
jgi:beta-lactamase class D